MQATTVSTDTNVTVQNAGKNYFVIKNIRADIIGASGSYPLISNSCAIACNANASKINFGYIQLKEDETTFF